MLNSNIEQMFPPNHESSWVKVVCARTDYSASRIARAVEDCDAHLLNLNILATSPSADTVAVLLRVGMRHGQSVVRSLARYGYDAEVVSDPTHPMHDVAENVSVAITVDNPLYP